MDARFYSIADSAYFIGLVGLINSVRASGNSQPFLVVDTGLTGTQRELLQEHVELLDGPSDLHAFFIKDIGMRSRPADVMIFLDADVLCVRNLDPLIAEASRGRVVVFEDRLALFDNERSGHPPAVYDAWKARLGLADLRSRPYVNAGMMMLPKVLGLELLQELKDAQRHFAEGEVFTGKRGVSRPSDPFYYGDQDLLNALLASPRYFDVTSTRPHGNGASPPYAGLVVGREGITCAVDSDADPPFLMHQVQSKPWLARMEVDAYYELLVRAVNLPGGPVRVPSSAIPPWLRLGNEGEAVRRRRARAAVLAGHVRGRLGISRALSDSRRRRWLAAQRRAELAAAGGGRAPARERLR